MGIPDNTTRVLDGKEHKKHFYNILKKKIKNFLAWNHIDTYDTNKSSFEFIILKIKNTIICKKTIILIYLDLI